MGDRKPIGVAYRDQDIDGSLSEAVQLTLHDYFSNAASING
jgi:hypothetical protein